MSRRLEYERVYQEYFAQYINHLDNDDTVALDAHSEIRMSDGTRCDVFLTDGKGREYAVEVDFIDKFTEGVTQAARYSLLTGKRPGLLVILEGQNPSLEEKKLGQLKDALEVIRIKCKNGLNKLGRQKYKWRTIRLWQITYEGLPLELRR